MNLKNVIGNGSHWMINKKLAKEIGLEATVFLQHLIDIEEEFFGIGNEFYQQQERILEYLPISERSIRDCQRILVDKKFISIVKKGIPAKNWFKINHEEILVFICEQQVVAKCDNKQSQNATTKSNNKESKNKVALQPSSDDYNFTSVKKKSNEAKIENKEFNEIGWLKLLSVWTTNEFTATLNHVKKFYWDKLSTETHQSILQMIEELGEDKQYLSQIWISDCFKNKKMNSAELKKEIEKRKAYQKKKLANPDKYVPGNDKWEF